MPQKSKPLNPKQPLYVAQRPDLEELKRQGQEYAHPRILVGHRIGDDQDYFSSDFAVEFQVTLKPAADDTATRDGHAYAGSVDLRLDQVVEASKVIARVRLKAEALAPDQRDEFHLFIVGLRGCGYKEAVMAKERQGLYYPGRRHPAWLKVKGVQEDSFVVCGYTAGEGWREGLFGALLLGRPDGRGGRGPAAGRGCSDPR